MPEITLEALAKRLEAVEKELAELKRPTREKDWQSAVGMFTDSEFMRQVDAEALAIREADRNAAREGRSE